MTAKKKDCSKQRDVSGTGGGKVETRLSSVNDKINHPGNRRQQHTVLASSALVISKNKTIQDLSHPAKAWLLKSDWLEQRWHL